MNAKIFRLVILYMANEWDREEACEVFGNVMGNHYFAKWMSKDRPDLGTMRLFYDMDEDNLQKLINRAIEKHISYLKSRVVEANEEYCQAQDVLDIDLSALDADHQNTILQAQVLEDRKFKAAKGAALIRAEKELTEALSWQNK